MAAAEILPFDPHRFRSAAAFYGHRAPYPDLLFDRLAALTGLAAGQRALDLGCGPGPIALALAARGIDVTAVDPEPAMLEEGRRAAAAAGLRIAWAEGSSYDLPAGLAPVDIVTMGRSFHWMDRDATLAALDCLVRPRGAIALLHDAAARGPSHVWRDVIKEVSDRFSAASREMRRRRVAWEGHEVVLLRSAFCRIETIGVVIRRELTADEVVGRAYSTSGSSPDALGAARPAFEAALREALAAASPEGIFEDISEARAMVARRPACPGAEARSGDEPPGRGRSST